MIYILEQYCHHWLRFLASPLSVLDPVCIDNKYMEVGEGLKWEGSVCECVTVNFEVYSMLQLGQCRTLWGECEQAIYI